MKGVFLLATAMWGSNHTMRRVIRVKKRRELLRAEHVKVVSDGHNLSFTMQMVDLGAGMAASGDTERAILDFL